MLLCGNIIRPRSETEESEYSSDAESNWSPLFSRIFQCTWLVFRLQSTDSGSRFYVERIE